MPGTSEFKKGEAMEVTTEMKKLLERLADLTAQTSDEVYDDGKEDGTAGILKLCDQLADKIYGYLIETDETSEFKKEKQMSKIMDFLLQPDTIIFFDVDGVLAPYEFGKLRHCIGDYEWKQRLEAGEDLYSMISPIKLLQAFIKRKGTDNIYVCSKAAPEEYESKKKFCHEGYGIPMDHIFLTSSKKTKVSILKKFAKDRMIPEEKIAMVEDTVETLDMIGLYSHCATVHISSFFSYVE